MPQRTIAAGGGLFNSTSTWVEGIVPTSADFIVGNATSGQLTVNVIQTVQYLDLTNYNNTITFNSGQTLTLTLASGTTTFSSTTVWAGTGTLRLANVAQTINPNSCTSRIPNLDNQGGTKTVNTHDLYINNYTMTTSANTTSWTGGRRIRVGGNFTVSGILNPGHNCGTGGFTLDGTGTVNAEFLVGTVEIDTAGTITFGSTGLSFGAYSAGATSSIVYVAGTVVAPLLKILTTTITTSFTFNTGGMTWDNVLVRNNYTSSQTYTLALSSNLNTTNLLISGPAPYSGACAHNFTGTGALTVNGTAIIYSNSTNAESQFTIRLNTTAAHSIAKLFTLSPIISGGHLLFRSTTNGTQATLNLGDKNNSPIMYTDFTDINAGGGQEIKTYNGTVSNCTNVASYTSTIFGGGGGSFTFVN